MTNDELLDIGIQKRNGEITISWDELNIKYSSPFKNGEAWRNFTRKTLTKQNNNNSETNNISNDTDETKYKETLEVHSDGKQTSDKLIEMTDKQSKDINYILKSHGFSEKDWQLVSAKNSFWNANTKQDGLKTLYSSRITVKPRDEYLWTEKDAQKIFASLKTDYRNKINIYPQQCEKNNDILVLPIADFHLGLFADGLSTGNDYNLQIAEELYYHVLDDIINRVKDRKFEKILFIVGNDFVNADNLSGTTTKGTPQDSSNSWFEIVNKATQLIIAGTDMLTNIAPVDVLYVPSNHDLHTMFGVMQTIKAWYKNDDNVNVDDSPMTRKYYQFGEVLLPLSHDIKVKEALKIITSEAKDKWSQSTHVYCMLAHLHTAMQYEKQGYLEIMRLPTISGHSRWTNQMGYVQTEKRNQAFIINGKLGMTDILNTIINL